jgi:hypothetical protein
MYEVEALRAEVARLQAIVEPLVNELAKSNLSWPEVVQFAADAKRNQEGRAAHAARAAANSAELMGGIKPNIGVTEPKVRAGEGFVRLGK